MAVGRNPREPRGSLASVRIPRTLCPCQATCPVEVLRAKIRELQGATRGLLGAVEAPGMSLTGSCTETNPRVDPSSEVEAYRLGDSIPGDAASIPRETFPDIGAVSSQYKRKGHESSRAPPQPVM